MLILPNMDPTPRPHRPSSLPQALLQHGISVATRLSTLIVKVVGMALAMFLVPRMMHALVLCLDDVYGMLGRRAASPWEMRSLSGYGLVVGLAIMVLLHLLLFNLAYHVILDDDQETSDKKKENMKRQRDITWERVLMRIIVPLLLCGGLCVMIWRLWRLSGNRELVRANTVNFVDDASAGLIWRDR